MTSDNYFYKTKFKGDIQNFFLENLDHYSWTTGTRQSQWEISNPDQSLISVDPLLSQIHKEFNGRLNFFKFPPETNYVWHTDGKNLFNLNLIITKQDSLTIFERVEGDYDTSSLHHALKPIVVLDYEPCYWYMFNAQIRHSVFNFSKEVRFLLTYNIPKTSEIDYNQALESIKKL
jgi:hypothetical protein